LNLNKLILYSYDSFYNLSYWLNEIKTNCNKEVIIFLVANKSDMKK